MLKHKRPLANTQLHITTPAPVAKQVPNLFHFKIRALFVFAGNENRGLQVTVKSNEVGRRGPWRISQVQHATHQGGRLRWEGGWNQVWTARRNGVALELRRTLFAWGLTVVDETCDVELYYSFPAKNNVCGRVLIKFGCGKGLPKTGIWGG